MAESVAPELSIGLPCQTRRVAFTAGIAAQITGHRKQTISHNLYSGGDTIKVMREAMVRIDYRPKGKKILTLKGTL